MKVVRYLPIVFFITIILFAVGISAQSLIANPECVTYDVVRDRYLVSCLYSGRIIAIDSNGIESIFWKSPRLAWGSHIKGDFFYVSIESDPASVAVIDLETGTFIKKVTMPGCPQLDGMTIDTSGNLYVVASINNVVMRLDLATDSTFIFARVSASPQDIYFDSVLNRLVVVGYKSNAPIQAISLPDGTVTHLTTTAFGKMDGIACDSRGRYYVSCSVDGNIYRYDSDFVNPPVIVSSDHISPSNLCLNYAHNILAVPNYDGYWVDFIGLDAEFNSDVSYGKVPLTVNFTGSSINYGPDSWHWDFGDNDTAEGSTADHTYNSIGLYDVDLGIDVGSEAFHRRKKNFIFVHADSLIGPQINTTVGSKIVVPIYANNTTPIKKIVIPFNYSGDAVLRWDSITTTGCQTSDFLNQSLNPLDDTNKKLALTLSGGLLEPGRNSVANVYLTVLSASGTRMTNLTFNTIGIHQPRFTSNLFD